MSLRNTSQKYGKITIMIHWLMALIIISLIAVGFYMHGLEDGAPKWAIYDLHKATGFIVLLLALFRWYWMLTSQKLTPLASFSKFDIKASILSKWLLMSLILLMPLSGFLMSVATGKALSIYGLFNIPSLMEQNKPLAGFFHSMHGYLAWAITTVVALHIIFAFKHHLIRKDDTLNRMLARK